MGILRWLGLSRPAPEPEKRGGSTWYGQWLDAGMTPASGIAVGPETSLQIAAFYCGVSLISRQIASLPLQLYQRAKDGGKSRATKHPLYAIIHAKPNGEQTAYQFRESMQSWALRWGNAFAEIERQRSGRPVAVWPISATQMSVRRDDDGNLVYIQRMTSGGERIIRAENMLHIKAMGDGLVGKSQVQLFRESLGLTAAAEMTGAALFGNGMRMSVALEHPGALGKEARDNIAASISSAHSGAGNTGKVFILEEGMKLNQYSIPPEDAQFLETRTFQVREIARMLHVPPHKLADLADATFSNVEESNIDFVVDCLQPWATNWEQEIDAKLLLPEEQERYFSEFTLEGLLRGNSAARAEFYSKMFNIGTFSVNEIRAKENMNGIGSEGDAHFVPLNMVPIDRAINPPEPKPAPVPAPAPVPDKAQDDDARTAGVEAAHRDLLLDACGRVVRMEANGLRKALKDPEKYADTWPKLLDMAHESRIGAILGPCIAASAAVIGDGMRPAWAMPLERSIALTHVAEARTLAGNGIDEDTLAMWESTAASALVDQIFDALRPKP